MTTLKTFNRIMNILGKRKYVYLTAIFFMSTSFALFSVMGSMLLKSVMDAAQNGDADSMPYIIVANVAVGLAALLVYKKSAIAYNVEAKRAYAIINKKMFWHEVRLPYNYYENTHSGEFMSKISYDVSKIGSIFGSRFRRTVSPILQVIVFLIPMLILDYRITLLLIMVNAILLFINGLFVGPIRRVSKRLSNTSIKLTERLSDLLSGLEQVRMYEAGAKTVEDFSTQNKCFAKQSFRKSVLTAMLESCNKGFDMLCALVFLMIGIYFVSEKLTTLGNLTAIYTLYCSFSTQFLQLGRYYPELLGCFVNAENVFEFLELEREPENWYKSDKGEKGDEKIDSELALEINNITFSYNMDTFVNKNRNGESEENYVIKELSLNIKKGESVAIVGHSGCGKTTLSKLILNLYPLAGGDIKAMDSSYKQSEMKDIRERIAYVPQEPYLFSMSIAENIRLGKTDATDEEIVAAAKLANAHEFIIQQEDGYDTFVGERGNKLSGGQKQRIAIARAIIRDADIILLDEATSALDNESEIQVNEALRNIKKNKTVIMIAHRPSTIELADRVIDITKK